VSSGFRDPSFDLVYGASKLGKTTDVIYSCPCAFFLAPPGALKPSVNVVGHDIPAEHCFDPKSVPEATNKLKEIASKKCSHCGQMFREAAVDDFSLLTELSFAKLEARGLSGWKLWGALQDEVLDFRDTARRLGIHVIMNCHEQGAKMVNGLAQRGGPKLPGRLPESLPAGCDMVLRAAAGGTGIGTTKLGWAGVYKCNPNDPGYVTGDRHGVTPDTAPMNIGEILRAAGYEIRRAPGLEWMDGAVQTIAEVLWKSGPGGDASNLRDGAQWLMQNGIDNGLHMRWVIRDAYDRVVIARARANPLAMFGI
jgi:hypothetical protein